MKLCKLSTKLRHWWYFNSIKCIWINCIIHYPICWPRYLLTVLNCGIHFKWQMEEVSLLADAVSQIDEPFLLAIVVIVCWTSTNSGSKIYMGISSYFHTNPFLFTSKNLEPRRSLVFFMQDWWVNLLGPGSPRIRKARTSEVPYLVLLLAGRWQRACIPH